MLERLFYCRIRIPFLIQLIRYLIILNRIFQIKQCIQHKYFANGNSFL